MFKVSLLSFIIAFFSTVYLYAIENPVSKEPGDKVDDFNLKSIDGSSYSINGAKNDKAVVIIFWSTQCPNVQPYNERVSEMYNEYVSKGIAIWAINSNNTESIEEVTAHAKKNNYPFPMLKDYNNIVADKFGATRTPEVFVIDPSSKTVLYHGRIDDNREANKVTSNDLRNALDEIVTGKEISVKSTKSFGCSIKRID